VAYRSIGAAETFVLVESAGTVKVTLSRVQSFVPVTGELYTSTLPPDAL
jgi:hypothetical protein